MFKFSKYLHPISYKRSIPRTRVPECTLGGNQLSRNFQFFLFQSKVAIEMIMKQIMNIWFDASLIVKINSMTTRLLLLLQLLKRENCSEQPNVDISASESPFIVQQHLANIIQTTLNATIYALCSVPTLEAFDYSRFINC